MIPRADRPLVSILILSHNNERTLGQAIDSALGQTYPNVEVIVTDNASTDGSRRVMERYAGDARVRLLYHDTNDPPTKRRNEGVRVSRGEFIAILDDDDYYLPTLIEREVEVFQHSPASVGVVYTPCVRWNVVSGESWVEHRLGVSGRILRGLLMAHRTFICAVSPLIRRRCLEQYPFHEDLFWEAEGWFFRAALTWEFAYIDEPLVVQRERPGNAGKAIRMGTDISMRILERLRADPAFPHDLDPLVDAARSRTQRNLGLWALRIANDPALARRSFLDAIRWDRRRVVDARTVAGLSLSLLPAPLVRAVNRALDHIRRHRHLLTYQADLPERSTRA